MPTALSFVLSNRSSLISSYITPNLYILVRKINKRLTRRQARHHLFPDPLHPLRRLPHQMPQGHPPAKLRITMNNLRDALRLQQIHLLIQYGPFRKLPSLRHPKPQPRQFLKQQPYNRPATMNLQLHYILAIEAVLFGVEDDDGLVD